MIKHVMLRKNTTEKMVKERFQLYLRADTFVKKGTPFKMDLQQIIFAFIQLLQFIAKLMHLDI